MSSQPSNPFGQQPSDPFAPAGGAYGVPPFGPPQPLRTSKLAILSLISAIVAPVLACTCIPTLVLSLFAVVGGHWSWFRISRSGGTIGGKGLSVAAFALGWPVLLLSLVMAPGFISGFMKASSPPAPGEEVAENPAFERAEKNISLAKKAVANGNTPQAVELAKKFSEEIKLLRETLFTENKGLSLSGGEFITHCQLHPGKCAFLVHVPGYRKFEDDAKESLAELAWIAAQSAAGEVLNEGDRLALGMKGTLLYGNVTIGVVVKGESDDDGIQTSNTDKNLLLPFFDEEPLADPQIELPAEPTSPPTEISPPAEPAAESPIEPPPSTTDE